MFKDFDKWNDNKKRLDSLPVKFYFKAGEIWWCSIGINVAVESNGKGQSFRRPILIIKKLTNQSCIGVPLSTKHKKGTWYCQISIHGNKRTLLLNQIRMLSANRLERRMWTIDNSDLKRVKQKLKYLLEL